MIRKPEWTDRMAGAMEMQMYWMTNIIKLNNEMNAVREIIKLYEHTIFVDEVPDWEDQLKKLEEYRKDAEAKMDEAAKIAVEEIEKRRGA
jgi:hypothetical protein